MGKIKYDPELSVEEIAQISGVKVPTVRKYIQENHIDREYDSQLIKFRRVQQYFKNHPDSTLEQAAKALGKGYTRNTIKKFRDPADAPKPNGNKIYLSMVDATMSKSTVATMSDEDRIILGIILRLYLHGSDRFDCDLTFSKGDFYRYGLQYPTYCFDLYPQQPVHLVDAPLVQRLAKGNELDDNSLASVVIDLPQHINEDSIHNPDAFQDITHLAVSYYDMLNLAYRKLRYTSDIQSGGLLIIKVGDIAWQGKMLWMSKIVTELATGRLTAISKPVYDALKNEAERRGHSVEEEFPLFDLELTDKYVHTYDPSQIESPGNRSHSIKAHDYFLVFRKGEGDTDSEIFYYGADTDIQDKEQLTCLLDDRDLGPRVESRRSQTEGRRIYEVKMPIANDDNHIDVDTVVSQHIRRRVNDELGCVIPKYATGGQFLEEIRRYIFDKLTAESNPEPSFRKTPSSKAVSKETRELLRKVGVTYIQTSYHRKRNPQDRFRTITDINAIEIKLID